jgi:hypothetical protein
MEDGVGVCPHCGEAAANPLRSSIISQDSSPLPSKAPEFMPGSDLKGIGGWLILVAFNFVLAPILLLRTIFTVNAPYFFGANHQNFLSNHPGSVALRLFELTSNSILVALWLYLNFVFYRKRRELPTLAIFCLIARYCVFVVDILANHSLYPSLSLAKQYQSIPAGLVALFIWVPYFLYSERVKATFIY